MLIAENKQEKELLIENELRVNDLVANILFFIGIITIPLIFLLGYMNVFIFEMREAAIPLLTTLLLFVLPKILTYTKLYKKSLFKYIIIFSITLSIPTVYIQFDYMALIVWVFPMIISSYYFNKQLDKVTLIFSVLVLGVTSYYRSYLRFQKDLIDEVVGGLLRDFTISYITYAMLLVITYVMINLLTKKTNEMLQEMVKAKQFEFMSITDSLTGVYNHRFLLDTLEKKKLEFDRIGTPFSVILFDVDYFKKINDTFGHLKGDETLVKICTSLKNTVREMDIIGRYGGEEFMIILPSTTIEDAYKIAERCRKGVSKITIENLDVSITISGGVQQYNNHKIHDFINNVDNMLYKAKHSGRNRVTSA